MSEIIKITRDKERASALYEMITETLEELDDIKKTKSHRRIKDYYELIVQSITGIMYSNGFKTLSHIGLINYIKNTKELTQNEVKLIDSLRKLRHGIIYYGKKSGEEFLINNEQEILVIIEKLKKLLENRIRK